jgi:ADP-heptose:LPS heptosyltransferase
LKAPDRILLVRLSHLGDVVCAMPVFHALRAAYPRAALGWALESEFAGLVRGLPGLEHAFCLERRGGLAAWRGLRRELCAFDAELAVDAQGNMKSAAVLLLSGARRRVGLAPAEWRERTGARVLTEHAPPSGATHVIERMFALAHHVGGGSPRRADLDLAPHELDAARRELAALFPAPGGARCGITILHLSRTADIRAWPREHYRSLATLLAERDTPVLCVSGPAEEEAGLALARELGGGRALRHMVGQRDLRALAALFAAAAEGGGRFLGVDSGPMHLACAAGLAVVCLEGPQEGARTGPWTLAGAAPECVVRAREGPECAPCLRRRCDHREGPVCMRAIDPAQALAALR